MSFIHIRIFEGFKARFWVFSLYFWYLWFIYTTADLKVRSFLYAFTWSVIEFLFHCVTSETPDGVVTLNLTEFNLKKGFTTFAMFFVNILYTPVLIDGYLTMMNHNWFMIILCFPLNMWIGEIVMGYYLLFIYEKCNPRAWEYHGHDAFFSGNIKLSYAKYWFLLGVVTYATNPYISKLSQDIVIKICL